LKEQLQALAKGSEVNTEPAPDLPDAALNKSQQTTRSTEV
jgi:hypothetical protein